MKSLSADMGRKAVGGTVLGKEFILNRLIEIPIRHLSGDAK